MIDYSDHFQQTYSQDNPETEAYGWIQWKGTDVCMDIHCICGAHGHIDADFAYYIECPHCGRVYATGQNIKLIELDAANKEFVEGERPSMIKTSDYDEEKIARILK